MEKLLLKNARIITGEQAGENDMSCGFLLIKGHRIERVGTGSAPSIRDATVIDLEGAAMLPGIINAHSHGLTGGPSMPSGSRAFPAAAVHYQRNRHLLSGTTTALNVCGLVLPEDIDAGCLPHPLDVHVATAHSPSSIAAAKAVDGAGLLDKHMQANARFIMAAGAKALGEAGGGQTLGGSAQDYRFIPEAIRQATGVQVHPLQARRLKDAILGAKLDGKGRHSDTQLAVIMEEADLSDRIAVSALRALVTDTVMPPVKLAMDGLEELARLSAEIGVPAIFHTAAPTIDTLLRLAATYRDARMIAGHANHPSFSTAEAVDAARRLRALNVAIDVSTLDGIETRWRNTPDTFDALIEARLVDTISTDFAGGDWDSILGAVQRIVRKGQMRPADAIALATGNVARLFTALAGDRGILRAGKRADIVIAEAHNFSRVRHVISNGRFVVIDGQVCSELPEGAVHPPDPTD